MEQIQQAITQLTGALNAQIEQMKLLNNRMTSLEKANTPPSPSQDPTLSVPRTETDLLEPGTIYFMGP